MKQHVSDLIQQQEVLQDCKPLPRQLTLWTVCTFKGLVFVFVRIYFFLCPSYCLQMHIYSHFDFQINLSTLNVRSKVKGQM